MFYAALLAALCVVSQAVESGSGFATMRRESLHIQPHDNLVNRDTPVQHPSKRRHRKGTDGGTSLLQQSGQSRQQFPLYPRSQGYVHPLDSTGQAQEKHAVADLSSSNVMGKLTELLEFPTRSYSNLQASQKVEHFLKSSFEKHTGFTSCLHNFHSGGDASLTNVIAHVPGTTADTVTIGAHYDSRPFNGKAPGAEDNGSGVAALMAMAKAFADAKIKPKASVYFVAFAGEEPGLLGSKAFADALYKNSEGLPEDCKSSSSILKMRELQKGAGKVHKAIIMDEVGWASPALTVPTVNLESYDWTTEVMDHLRESSQTHNGDSLAVVHSNHPFGSDHMSFLDNQMQGVLTINGDDESYPSYHQSSDTIEKVSGELLSMISKMNMGALIRIAGTQ